MYKIVKKIHFSYAHRLMGHPGKCANLHGHNGLVEIEISGPILDNLGMLVDFAQVKTMVTNWIEEHLDHRTILKTDDPLSEILTGIGEEVFLMDTHPTAENLARLIFRAAGSQGLPVSAVRFWETPASMAEYSETE
ncbi:MAG: 6-carboxytetrahydropterin synthase [Acidobacteriota bacterium]